MFNRILLAVDGSEHSDKAVGVARDLARQFESDLLVLHVRERLVTRRGVSETEIEDRGLGEELARSMKGDGVNAQADEPLVPHGRVSQQIAEVARATDREIIVMGSRGLSNISGMFLGSVTHKVLHLAHCPVLVVR